MSIEAFLKLDGIDGESAKDGHTGEIEIKSVNWGTSHASTGHTGTGHSSGKVDFADISIMKVADKSSPKLMLRCCDGKTIGTGKITFRKTAGDSKIDFLTYALTNVMVTSWQQSGNDSGDDQVAESVSFAATKVVVTYLPQKADGSADAKQQGGWDQGVNKVAAGA
jgi:type VI secretion system secreted protein Hcp